jgi:hypothetical protein
VPWALALASALVPWGWGLPDAGGMGSSAQMRHTSFNRRAAASARDALFQGELGAGYAPQRPELFEPGRYSTAFMRPRESASWDSIYQLKGARWSTCSMVTLDSRIKFSNPSF